MPTTYKYSISNLEYSNDDTKGVLIAHYRITATDADESVTSYGTINFTPNSDYPNFTPFEQLTEQTVVGWVKDTLDTVEIEQSPADKLNEKLNPTVASGVPWNTDSE